MRSRVLICREATLERRDIEAIEQDIIDLRAVVVAARARVRRKGFAEGTRNHRGTASVNAHALARELRGLIADLGFDHGKED